MISPIMKAIGKATVVMAAIRHTIVSRYVGKWLDHMEMWAEAKKAPRMFSRAKRIPPWLSIVSGA